MTLNQLSKKLFFVIFAFGLSIGSVNAQAPGSSVVISDSDAGQILQSDVCPEPRSALSNTPNDLAQIQADITRFTLCVQRSQLLERLNELTMQNIKSIDSAIEFNIGPTLDNFAPQLMESIPVPDVPDLPEANPADLNIMDMDISNSSKKGTWRIRDISGKDKKLKATLISDAGVIVNAFEEDTLPDEGQVISISVSGVEVRYDDSTETLKWFE